ncbi:MAG: hypothetical protein ACP5Q3_10670 [bacterium]
MLVIAPIEDLKAVKKELLEVRVIRELRGAFKKWRRIEWKNI